MSTVDALQSLYKIFDPRLPGVTFPLTFAELFLGFPKLPFLRGFLTFFLYKEVFSMSEIGSRQDAIRMCRNHLVAGGRPSPIGSVVSGLWRNPNPPER